MQKFFFILLITTIFFLTGCTQNFDSNEIDVTNINQEYNYKSGKIVDIIPVKLKDDGSGTIIGGTTGYVIGSLFGNYKWNIVTSLIGGLTGGFLGNKIGKSNGKELFVRFTDGETKIIVVKGIKNLNKGDKIRIIKNGNKILRIEKLF